ncbi:MAG: hypothetical protein FJ272_03935 [Planctomycetes bacterium]|nr:hypothetical protein [Planctomycetota bacterium]
MKRAFILLVVVLMGLGAAGCTKVQKGGLIGALAGAGVGGAWASTAGVLNAGEGMAVGAATGAAGGTLVADALDDGKESEVAKTDNLSEAEVENLRAQKDALERALADARSKGADTEKDLASKLDERSKQLADLDAQRQALESSLADARQKTAELEKDIGGKLSEKDKQLEGLRRELEGVKVERTSKGITLTFLSEILFDSGKATLKPQGQEILRKACAVVKEKFTENELTVEGHTDNVPIKHSGYKSNWELSSDRALAVLHHMEKEGFEPTKLSATGYGEFRPVASNDSAQGRTQNRRAVIVIMPKEVEVARQRLDVQP